MCEGSSHDDEEDKQGWFTRRWSISFLRPGLPQIISLGLSGTTTLDTSNEQDFRYAPRNTRARLQPFWISILCVKKKVKPVDAIHHGIDYV